jgi:hypothetical protein
MKKYTYIQFEDNLLSKTINNIGNIEKMINSIFKYIKDDNLENIKKNIIQIKMIYYRSIIIDEINNSNNLNNNNFNIICKKKLNKFINKYLYIIHRNILKLINNLLYIYKNIDYYEKGKLNYHIILYSEQHITIQFLFFLKYLKKIPEDVIDIFYIFLNDKYKIISNNDKNNVLNSINKIINSLLDHGYEFNCENKIHKKLNAIPYRLYTENINNVISCPICFEDKNFIDIISTDCNHVLCYTCYIEMYNHLKPYNKLKCSMCRNIIKKISTGSINIYNYLERSIN